ncbi:hypothetical protein BOTBODRAFT_104689 [Botryobasidium botryosum FD-172 SS1]|uniref:Tetrapyrrole methylase domain-containing protein n=1 Tax=Botryobasidium botryosum (strain FD-172 SS1) TaxID=930990 RepID=A0A067N298_BOTB1|nr:hypothetical protein BOTBODRAFT_104689 [Botryobasidium botryosum FD-172 SS1]
MAQKYPTPHPGASLILSFKPVSRTIFIIGSNALAASRAFYALEAEAKVVISAPGGLSAACDEIQWRVEKKEIDWIDTPSGLWESLEKSGKDDKILAERAFGHFLDSLSDVMLTCITDTLIDASITRHTTTYRRSFESASLIAAACRLRHIPLNVSDTPSLCDYTFPAVHRFPSAQAGAQSRPTSLQFAITANGKGCRLATRIRRDIISTLPKGAGDAVENVGRLRSLAKLHTAEKVILDPREAGVGLEEEDAGGAGPPLNEPVSQRSSVQSESLEEATKRRMAWVAQISEYWPIERLAALGEAEMLDMLADSRAQHAVQENEPLVSDASRSIPSQHSLTSPGNPPPTPAQGQILLVGSGPGHPSLLTRAAHTALTSLATLVLSDKLVPAEVLALIPPHVPLHIAKKFPGNADGAQNELMDMALEGLKKGEVVVRLKQGDPFLYGRGGEEVLFFRSHGYEAVTIPGISSALAGPLFGCIPVTQRGVAESLTICTGVGRAGRAVQLPGYERSRTLVILMGVARLGELVSVLVGQNDGDGGEGGRRRAGVAYPPYTPIAVIERASCPDQRVVLSTLDDIVGTMARCGEQRPPGMILVGWAALALESEGDLTVLDGGGHENVEALDRHRVQKWLQGRGHITKEGLADMWSFF